MDMRETKGLRIILKHFSPTWKVVQTGRRDVVAGPVVEGLQGLVDQAANDVSGSGHCQNLSPVRRGALGVVGGVAGHVGPGHRADDVLLAGRKERSLRKDNEKRHREMCFEQNKHYKNFPRV